MKINKLKMKRIVYREKKCYAINNMDTEKLDENSEFYIGSVTKLFTAISLLILHQEKKINIKLKVLVVERSLTGTVHLMWALI